MGRWGAPVHMGMNAVHSNSAHRACEKETFDKAVIAKSKATKQSSLSPALLDCFAALAMTGFRPPLARPLPPARPAHMARGRIDDDTPKGKIGNLLMIWRYALHYKWTIAGAATALFIAAGATLAIPAGFRRGPASSSSRAPVRRS